jgi:Recombination endonuclease VII
VKTRSKKTLQKYGLTDEAFAVLWEAHKGCCGICGIAEAELEVKFSDWRADQVLHIDHEHRTYPYRVRGLLCKDCNFDLAAYERKIPIVHPANRGTSYPRDDPRFREYITRTALSRAEKRKFRQPDPAKALLDKEQKLLEKWSHQPVKVTLKDGSVRSGILLGIPEEGTFQLLGLSVGQDDDEDDNLIDKVYRARDIVSIE